MWDEGLRCAGQFFNRKTMKSAEYFCGFFWAPFATVGRNLKAEFFISNLGAYGGVRVGTCANRKPTNDFILMILNASQYKVMHYPPPFGRNSNSPPFPQFDLVGQSGSRERGTKIVPIEMPTPHSYATSMHSIGQSCSV